MAGAQPALAVACAAGPNLFLNPTIVPSQRYSKGRYRVREGLPYAADVKRFIEGLGFLQIDDRTRITTASQRKRHRLYLFHFAPAKARVVMKVDTIDMRYPLLRRLELRITGLLRDGLRRSYEGALALEAAGIPSIKPLAQWTYRPSLF